MPNILAVATSFVNFDNFTLHNVHFRVLRIVRQPSSP